MYFKDMFSEQVICVMETKGLCFNIGIFAQIYQRYRPLGITEISH